LLPPAGNASPGAAAGLASNWRLFQLMHAEHSRHEDDIIFKAYDDWFPGVAQVYHTEHEETHVVLDRCASGGTSLSHVLVQKVN
jgi:hypothetical protein